MRQAQGGQEVDGYDFSNAFRALLCDGAKISGASILNRQVYGVNFFARLEIRIPDLHNHSAIGLPGNMCLWCTTDH